MRQPVSSRLLALLLVLVMLFAMVPSAWAAGGTDGEDGTGTTQEEGGNQDGGDGTDGTDGTEPPETPPVVASISLDQTTMPLKVGEKGTLTVKLEDSSGKEIATIPEGTKVEWVSSDPEEVRVLTASGSLTTQVEALKTAETNDPVKEVSITVTVTPKDSTALPPATCNVTVSPNDPAGVAVYPKDLELAPGQTGQLSATVSPETANQAVTWRTANSAIATVSDTGLVTGVAAGETTITATSVDGGKEASCAVTVQGIVLNDTSITIKERGNYTLNYTIYGPSIKNNTVTWTSSEPSIVRVQNGYLYGLAEGTATITAKVEGVTYTATCEVKVERNTAAVITAAAGAGEPLSFSSIQSQLQNRCSTVLGSSLSYIGAVSVPTNQGTLYYRYASESDTGAGVGNENYYVSPGLGQMALSDITFVPKDDFSGTAVISYIGYASGTNFFQGTIEVTVAELDGVSYSVTGSRPVQFNPDDFNRLCKNRTGRDLSYVVFSLPDSDRGTLYYRYLSQESPGTLVSASDQYKYSGTPALADVSFLPRSGYNGTVVISFTGYDVNQDSFRGRVEIKVTAAAGTGDLNYTVAQGGRLTLDADDFNSLCKELTGNALDYVRFTLPASSQGTLYYNYSSSSSYDSKVSENTSYYRSSSPYLRRVSFVANPDYSGNVSISFTGYDTKGNRFSGLLEITVGYTGTGDIRYSGYSNGMVTLDDADFNDLCRDLTGSTLNRVRFDSLPSSSQGDLYYNYDLADRDYDSRVTTSKSYYRSSTPYLDKVSFVPDNGFTGTVEIPFTGWNSDGGSFSGTVVFSIEAGSSTVSYTTDYNKAVTFDAGDFDRISAYVTGDDLRYVRFTLPDSAKGTLYYDYGKSGQSKVSATKSYYYSSTPYLDRVSFVPAEGFSGAVEIPFTGWSTGSDKFTGTVSVTVGNPPAAGDITYSTTHAPVSMAISDFQRVCNARGEGSLVSVSFTPPSSSAGRLYYRYENPQSYGSEVRSGTTYYPSATPSISEVTFVPKAGYQGTVRLAYTGTDSKGYTYSGSVAITITPNTTSQYFGDLGGYTWAAASIDYLYENQVVTGTGTRQYSPAAPVTRGDFILMVYRAFQLPGSGTSSFPDVPADSYYAQAVAAAKALGVVTGDEVGYFRPGDSITRQDAMVILQRAMQTTGWALGSGNTALLSGFSDGSSVSGYAQGAMATMVEFGVITGTNQGTLNPQGTLTRAEMAVVLHRLLTL